MSLFERWAGLSFDPPGGLGWLFILLALAAVAYAVWVYRRTEAPLSTRLRATLTALRAALLILLIVVLCRPVLSLAVPGGVQRGVLLLADRSLSMTLPGARPEETRDDELRRARADIEPGLRALYPLTVRPFSEEPGESLIEDAPLPEATGAGTGLAAALERSMAEGSDGVRPGAIVLLTDGVQTAGPDPVPLARRLGVPIAAVALGSDRPVADLALVRVRANRSAFLGERTPLEAVLRLQGLDASNIQVTLVDVTEEPRELARETVRVEAGGAERRVSVAFTPETIGLRFLEIRVSGLPGEATRANNRRLVALDVREDKTGILVLTGALTWDHTFIRRALDADSTLEVTAGIWRNGRFVSPGDGGALPGLDAESLRQWSVVLLDHVRPTQLNAAAQNAIAGFVRGGGGLAFVSGGDGDALTRWRGSPLEPLFPLVIGAAAAPRESVVRLSTSARRHVLFDPSAAGAPPLESWSNLPPLAVAPGIGSLKGHAEGLLTSSGGGAPEMVLSWAPTGNGRALLLAAGGIWRWDFLSSSRRQAAGVMPGWWRRAAQWLAQPQVETRLDVRPSEFVFGRGEAPRFVARALDQAYRPLPDVDVEVEVSPLDAPEGADAIRFALSGTEGFLSGEAGVLDPARYRYRAWARDREQELGVVEGFFAVDSLGVEFERLEADHELLARLAAMTGASVWSPDSLEGLTRELQIAAESDEEHRQFDLWDHPLTFALFVAIGSAEWFLRRRRGLI